MSGLDQTRTDIMIRLLPGSSRNQVIGREGDSYKVKVTSPPVDRKANKALVVLLAKRFRIARSSIEIVSGKSSRLKTVRVHGVSVEDVIRLMGGD